MDLSTILNLILGSTNVFTLVMLLRTFKSQVRKEVATADQAKSIADQAHSTAMQLMQSVYKTFIEDTKSEIAEMKETISELHSMVQNYKAKCDKCTHNQ
ncbi:MAG TPA: hypothetical protein VF581_07700 [Flavobacterium sp.]|jgi:uncharacterized coiled-coil DUF342 family protein